MNIYEFCDEQWADDATFRIDIIGSGPPGKSAYSYAVDGGYTGTEAEFYAALGSTGAAAVFQAATRYEFPNIGNPYTLYIATEENKSYRWDDTDLKYYCVGSDYNEIEIIYGGDANGEQNT